MSTGKGKGPDDLVDAVLEAARRHNEAAQSDERRAEIHDLVELLELAWRRHPEWRLGQLLVNAAPESWPDHDLYYLTDRDARAGLSRIHTRRPPSSGDGTGGW